MERTYNLKKYSSKIELDWDYKISNLIEDELSIKKNELENLKKDNYYPQVRSLILPYTRLQSKFHFQDALKLAEMDILFKSCPRSPVTPYVPSLLGYTSPLYINTADIGGGPGAFVEYIQFRYVNALTAGMTKRISNTNVGWDLKNLDPHRLIRFPGADYSGDFFTQWKSYLKMLEGQFAGGLDFISGYEWSEDNKKMDFLCFLEFYITIKTIKEGANAVIRMKANWSKLMMDIVYLATQVFEEVYLFQPLVSGIDSDEIYLVMNQALSEKENLILPIQKMLENIPDINKIQGVLISSLPKGAVKQFEEIRSDFIEKQIEIMEEIQNYLRIYSYPIQPKIDIASKLEEWALPDPYY
jgi:hypothetical protein